MVEKNELKKATCLLGDEKPMDTSDRIYELALILRRRSQELAHDAAGYLA